MKEIYISAIQKISFLYVKEKKTKNTRKITISHWFPRINGINPINTSKIFYWVFFKPGSLFWFSSFGLLYPSITEPLQQSSEKTVMTSTKVFHLCLKGIFSDFKSLNKRKLKLRQLYKLEEIIRIHNGKEFLSLLVKWLFFQNFKLNIQRPVSSLERSGLKVLKS